MLGCISFFKIQSFTRESEVYRNSVFWCWVYEVFKRSIKPKYCKNSTTENLRKKHPIFVIFCSKVKNLKHQRNSFQKECNLKLGFRFPAIRFDTSTLLSFSRRTHTHAKFSPVHEARLAKSFLVKRAQPHACVLSVNAFGKSHNTRLSRQSQHFRKPHMIFPHLTRAKHCQITP